MAKEGAASATAVASNWPSYWTSASRPRKRRNRNRYYDYDDGFQSRRGIVGSRRGGEGYPYYRQQPASYGGHGHHGSGYGGHGTGYSTGAYQTGHKMKMMKMKQMTGSGPGPGPGPGMGGMGMNGQENHKAQCCPLVVDPLALIALMGLLMAATMLLEGVITMTLGRKKRRRRHEAEKSFVEEIQDLAQAGREKHFQSQDHKSRYFRVPLFSCVIQVN